MLAIASIHAHSMISVYRRYRCQYQFSILGIDLDRTFILQRPIGDIAIHAGLDLPALVGREAPGGGAIAHHDHHAFTVPRSDLHHIAIENVAVRDASYHTRHNLLLIDDAPAAIDIAHRNNHQSAMPG